MVLHNGEAETIPPGDRTTGRPKWDELPRWQQAGILAMGSVELVLTTKALIDLVRRPAWEVRGPKTLWALGFAVQPFGPIAYLTFGRRR